MGKASKRNKQDSPEAVLPRDPKPLEGQAFARASELVSIAVRGATTLDKVCRVTAELDATAEHSSATAAAFSEVRRLRGEPVPRMACRAGCAYCCYIRVSALPIEIVAIAEYVRKRFDERQRADLVQRVEEHNVATRALAPAERSKALRPCPFLVENRCSIYEVRPLACRAHHSVDLGSCERAFRGEGVGAIPILRDHHSAIVPLIRGAYAGLSKSAGRAQDLEFIPAIGIALEEPGAAARWCAGEDAFKAALDTEQADARAEQRSKRL